MEPTPSNINNQQSSEERKHDKADDIWWTHRSSPKTEILNKPSHKYDHIPSRVNALTAAFQNSRKRRKFASSVVIL